ncbi:MAG: hypothetical protein RCG15_05545 [Candidatus Rickettsia vulgarisii]
MVKANGNLSINQDMSSILVKTNKPYVVYLLKVFGGDVHLYRQSDAESRAVDDIISAGGGGMQLMLQT